MRSHAYGLLHAICATAVRDELLSSNPCMITGATHAKRVHDPVVPDVDEITVIADKIEPRFKALILISAWCGLRFGEVTELRRKDFRYIKDDDNPAIIVVGRGVTHRSGNDPAQRCRIDTPKSGKTRTVVIPPHIRAEVQAHLDEYVEREPDSLSVRSRSRWLSRLGSRCARAIRLGVQIHWARRDTPARSAAFRGTSNRPRCESPRDDGTAWTFHV